MSKVVIVPEPHIFDKSFSNRIAYIKEIESYLYQVKTLAKELAQDSEVSIIFMGDVFHMGFTKMVPFVANIDWFKNLSQEFGGRVYSLIGNHELSYPQNNPFWMLADFDSAWYTNYRTIPGFGTAPCLKIRDQVVIDNTLFVFGHYRRDKFEYDYDKYDDVQFLTHNSIMDTEVINTLKSIYHRDPKMEYAGSGITSIRQAGSIPMTPKLSHMYVGHMHTSYSHFFVEETIDGVDLKFELQYLGSLGRTTHAEVDDTDLARSIPVIDTLTHEVEFKPFKLWERGRCVREEVVEQAQYSYTKTKAIAKLRKSDTVMASPVEGIREWLSQSPYDLDLFNRLIQNESISQLDNLLAEAGF